MDMTKRSRFEDINYTNWLRINYSLDLLHDMLHPFVKSQGKELWYEVISTWIKNHSRCKICNAGDISFNPRRVPRTKCWAINCPNTICGKWVEEIARSHAYAHMDKIAFSNCNLQELPFSHWEFTKAFMGKLAPVTPIVSQNSIETVKSKQRVVTSSGQSSKEFADKKKYNVSQSKPVAPSSKEFEDKNMHNNSPSKPVAPSSKEFEDKNKPNNFPSKPVAPSSKDIPTETQNNSHDDQKQTVSKSNRIVVGGRVMIVGKRRTDTKSNKVIKTPELPNKPKTIKNVKYSDQNTYNSTSGPVLANVKHNPSIDTTSNTKTRNNKVGDTESQKKAHLNHLKEVPKAASKVTPKNENPQNDFSSSVLKADESKCEKSKPPIPNNHTDEVIDLNQLLSFLVNCTALHTSVRRSRDQEGGLTAKHVIRIKKLMRLVGDIRSNVLPSLEDDTCAQLSSLILEVYQTMCTRFPGEVNQTKRIDQVLKNSLDEQLYNTFEWRQAEVMMITKHLQHIETTIPAQQARVADVTTLLLWLNDKPNQELRSAINAMFDMENMFVKFPDVRKAVMNQVHDTSAGTQTDVHSAIDSATQTDDQKTQPNNTTDNLNDDDALIHISAESVYPTPLPHQLPDIVMDGCLDDMFTSKAKDPTSSIPMPSVEQDIDDMVLPSLVDTFSDSGKMHQIDKQEDGSSREHSRFEQSIRNSLVDVSLLKPYTSSDSGNPILSERYAISSPQETFVQDKHTISHANELFLLYNESKLPNESPLNPSRSSDSGKPALSDQYANSSSQKSFLQDTHTISHANELLLLDKHNSKLSNGNPINTDIELYEPSSTLMQESLKKRLEDLENCFQQGVPVSSVINDTALCDSNFATAVELPSFCRSATELTDDNVSTTTQCTGLSVSNNTFNMISSIPTENKRTSHFVIESNPSTAYENTGSQTITETESEYSQYDLDDIKNSVTEPVNTEESHSTESIQTAKCVNASTQTLLRTWNAIDQDFLFTGARGYGISSVECYDLKTTNIEGDCVVLNNNGKVTVLYRGPPQYHMV